MVAGLAVGVDGGRVGRRPWLARVAAPAARGCGWRREPAIASHGAARPQSDDRYGSVRRGDARRVSCRADAHDPADVGGLSETAPARLTRFHVAGIDDCRALLHFTQYVECSCSTP